MIDQTLVDHLFPDRPAGYFDNAAVGIAPVPVAEAIAGVARALGRGRLGSPDWHELTDDTLGLMADEFGVPAERLSFLENTSTAMNIAARSLKLRDDARVLTFDDDFPSPRMPWLAIETVRVTEVAHGDDRTTALLDAIDDSIDVVSVTHVHATTGEVLDLERVHRACIDADALLLVDGAQAAGLLSFGAMHSDFYVGASYKWLLAGFGTAVTAKSERFDAAAEPVFRGYMNPAPSPRLEVGHESLFMLAALSAATRVRQSIGVEAIRQHTIDSVERIATAATEFGLPPLPNLRGAGIVSLRVADAPGLQRRLANAGITVAVREGALRISPHLTTTTEDIDTLLAGLDQAADYHRPEGAQ